MLPNPSRLNDSHRRLVIDASVAINLLGSRAIAEVIALLGRELHIERRTHGEVIIDPATGSPAAQTLAPLIRTGHLTLSNLDQNRIPDFVYLASTATPNGLDDGEAATIALADQMQAPAVLDEERAAKVARERYPRLDLLNSVDLFSAPVLLRQLGRQRVADLIYAACINARMRIPETHVPWVVEMLGPRVADCKSIRKRHRSGPRTPKR